MILRIDFETASRADLRKVGPDLYARDPSTRVLCLCYAVDDGPVRTWAPTFPAPADLLAALRDEDVLVEAHGASFERAIWTHVMAPAGWPRIALKRWRCSMAQAAHKGLPLDLKTLAIVVNSPHQKDAAGKRLLDRYAKPAKNGAFRLLPLLDGQSLMDYCAADVEAERWVSEFCGPLPHDEQRVFEIDAAINARGVAVDRAAAAAAKRIVEAEAARHNEELARITGGAVQTAMQIDELREWLGRNDVPMDGLDKDLVSAELKRKNLPAPARRVLEIRQEIGRAGVRKLDALLAGSVGDGRVRDLLQYHAATTGRWGGRRVQPQNFARPTEDGLDIDDLVADIMREDTEYLRMVYGSPTTAVLNAMRGMLVSGPGKKLVVGDFSAIEAIGLAGLAGEESKLDVFRRGESPYCKFAERVYGHPVTKKGNPKQYQAGKIGELAFGYQGGVNAWKNFDDSGTHTDAQINGYKHIWRDAHPNVEELWKGLQAAAIDAVARGRTAGYRDAEYGVTADRRWLWLRLPSGRRLWYFRPAIEVRKLPWSTEERPASAPVVTYWQMREGRWRKVYAYGGLQTENYVQAVCRDLLVHSMILCENEGLPVVLSVHDELVTEVDAGRSDALTVLRQVMEDRPAFTRSWPIKADCWEGTRYRK